MQQEKVPWESVDKRILRYVEQLNKMGLRTIASCEGHLTDRYGDGKVRAYVGFKDELSYAILLYTAKRIGVPHTSEAPDENTFCVPNDSADILFWFCLNPLYAGICIRSKDRYEQLTQEKWDATLKKAMDVVLREVSRTIEAMR